MRHLFRRKFLAYATALAVGSVVALGGTSAFGDTVGSADANAYGVQLTGPVAIDARPLVSATLQSGQTSDSLLEIPADPLATSFTAAVMADAQRESELEPILQGVMESAGGSLPTRWNATGHAITEDLEAASDTIMADVIESESVATCDGSRTSFGSAARIVNLVVGGTSIVVPDPAPNQVLLDQAGTRITFWETNWDPATGGTTDGSSTVFTNGIHVLGPAGIDLIISHTEATAECAAAQPGADKQCEDGVDNNDPEDSLADAEDPGCHSDGDPTNSDSYEPNDDDETDEVECTDGADNSDSEDTLADEADPGCHTDGDPDNASSFDENDDNESDDGTAPPATIVDGDPSFTG